MANVSLEYSGLASGALGVIVVGQLVCLDATGKYYVPATDANVAVSAAKAAGGVSLDALGAGQISAIRIQRSDLVAAGICFSATNNPGPVRRNSNGFLERATIDGTSDWWGTVYADGSVAINRGAVVAAQASYAASPSPALLWDPSNFGAWGPNVDSLPAWNAMIAAIKAGGTSAAHVLLPEGRGYFSGDLQLGDLPLTIEGRSGGGGNNNSNLSGIILAPGKQVICYTAPFSPTGGTFAGGMIRHVDFYSTMQEQTDGGIFGNSAGAMTATRAGLTAYLLGQCVRAAGGANTNVFWRVTTPGTTASGGDPAAFASTTLPGVTVSDGSVVWTSEAWTLARQNSHAYTVGQRVFIPGDTRYYFQCTVAGTSAGAVPAGMFGPDIGITVADGGVTWAVKTHTILIGATCDIDHCSVFGFSGYGFHVQSDWNGGVSGADFVHISNCNIQGTNGAVLLKGGDTNGCSVTDTQAIIMGFGRPSLNSFLGSGVCGFMDISLGGNVFVNCYTQDGLGPGWWLNPVGAACVVVGCHNENNYFNCIGVGAQWVGFPAGGTSGIDGGLVSAGAYNTSMTTRVPISGMRLQPGACLGIQGKDDSGAHTLSRSLIPGDALTFSTSSYSTESGAVDESMSDLISGWGVGWHTYGWGLGPANQCFAIPGNTAKFPSGNAPVPTSGDCCLWVLSRLAIGQYNQDPDFIDFGSGPPGSGYYTVGSVRWDWNAGAGGRQGWRGTTNGSPGVWVAFGPGYSSLQSVSTTPVTLDGTKDVISVDSSGGAITVKLPASPQAGQRFDIFDAKGNAGTNNITIDGNGHNIRAAATLVLSAANNCATVVWDATNTRWLARVTT